MISGGDFERSDSRKRRRLSERRRVFSRIGLNYKQSNTSQSRGSLSTEPSSWSSSSGQQQVPDHLSGSETATAANPLRSDSPIGGDGKISMKIQIHITVAPENEPLILADTSSLTLLTNNNESSQQQDTSSSGKPLTRKKSDSISIGEHIHERLSRQNTLSTRRRQQLMALHQQPALETGQTASGSPTATGQVKSEDDLRTNDDSQVLGRAEQSGRSSTITGGVGCDEATARFLANARYSKPNIASPLAMQPSTARQSAASIGASQREHIYFKRDGQRFGHEFTLKLAVDRTYRCLLKVRPLLPLQGISIQGHHVLFADCSQVSSSAGGGGVGPSSAPASSTTLSRSWQNIGHPSNSPLSIHNTRNMKHSQHHQPAFNHHHHNQNRYQNSQSSRLNHALTTGNLATATTSHGYRNSEPINTRSPSHLLQQQQQHQMMRHFAASHCSSSSNSHLGSQLIYMFDWSASRFEVNKNKNRTEVQTVLKFKNGQILSLPLQVKFYQSECKQHLSWGSQLHFIDYDCQINDMGQMSVDRVHYY